MSTEERKPKAAPQPQRGGARRNYNTEKEKKTHTSPVPQSERQNYPKRPRRQGGGVGRTKKKGTRKAYSHVSQLSERPDYPDHDPVLNGGGSAGCQKKQRSHAKPGPKLRKRVLGHNRAAMSPRPAPTLGGGGRQDKTRRNTPKTTQKTQKT